MSTKLYVSNLPLSATAEALTTRFGKFGDVISVVLEPVTHPSRRGAIIEMNTSGGARKAIAALNLSDLDGRLISVFFAPSVAKSAS